MPKVIIFAGANGTGKTTLANSLLDKKVIFINADAIQAKTGASDIQASKKAIQLIDYQIYKNDDFAFESTMSGRFLLKRIRSLQNNSFKIVIFYLFAYPLELLYERVKERVKKGGHYVPKDDIRRRYYRSADNFWNNYRYFSDEWAVINNNEFQYKNVCIGRTGTSEIIDTVEFEKFKEAIFHAKKRN